jgi:ATP-binding protein involved in chromosome partitioning
LLRSDSKADRFRALDFRARMIDRRLAKVKNVVLVMSGKGGVGKSVVSATLAALLSGAGLSVGLMDADIYGPSAALLLGTHSKPEEGSRGLIPPRVHGIKIMSVDLFAPGEPVPLTGKAAAQVITEMLALTYWGSLDFLVVDMPPATSDIMMLFTSLKVRGLTAIVVTMPGNLSLAVARRVLDLLRSGQIPVVGVLGNMVGRDSADGGGPQKLAREFHARFLGNLPYDAQVPKAANKGNTNALLETQFARALKRSMGQSRGLRGLP